MFTDKAVLFDLDSTLTDHDTAFARWGEQFADHYGVPMEWLVEADHRHRGQRHDFFADIKNSFGVPESIATLHAKYRRRTAELVPHRAEVCAAIGALKDTGWRLGVVTNGDPASQRLKLRRSRLAPLFGTVVISGEYGIRKPDPTIFRIALDDLRTDSAVVIGDDLGADIAGGNAAGLTTVWVKGDRERSEQDPVPSHTVSTVIEAAELLLSGALAPPLHPTAA